uniref:UBA domain-containing protein n=1 Tax=Knipowitschia caucasica TaxID=637954 RepID=A0AAV2LLS8_KNICA
MPEFSYQEELIEDVHVTVPDYLKVLRETEYDFSLEKWVLAGLQNGIMKLQCSPTSSSSSSCSSSSSTSLQPTCPPYWMMFSSPQQSRLASRHNSDFWEPNPRQRSHSLTLPVLRTKFTISDLEDESESNNNTFTQVDSVPLASTKELPAEKPCRRGQRKNQQRAFVPDLLHPPTCLSSLPHQRRKNLRQYSLCALDVDQNTARDKGFIRSDSVGTRCRPKMGKESISPNSCLNPGSAPRPLGRPSAACDSAVELLSALSPEERELLGVITSRGYPLRTAIIALQKTGRQAPEKVLSYLLALDHLCQLGYDVTQVEEALEMFQNCETKAEEFLHLLSQFNEMGFQQNAIKEVLLVHENHRERALEELMMRVA